MRDGRQIELGMAAHLTNFIFAMRLMARATGKIDAGTWARTKYEDKGALVGQETSLRLIFTDLVAGLQAAV